jgi:hypothetical protein
MIFYSNHLSVIFPAPFLALVNTCSSSTGEPPLSLLSSAAAIKVKISIVSSALTGGIPVLKNPIISLSRGLYPLYFPSVAILFSPKTVPP